MDLRKPSSPKVAIELAQIKGEKVKMADLQLILRLDATQRSMMSFHFAMNKLKAVSSIEPGDIEFESEVATALSRVHTTMKDLEVMAGALPDGAKAKGEAAAAIVTQSKAELAKMT